MLFLFSMYVVMNILKDDKFRACIVRMQLVERYRFQLHFYFRRSHPSILELISPTLTHAFGELCLLYIGSHIFPAILSQTSSKFKLPPELKCSVLSCLFLIIT